MPLVESIMDCCVLTSRPEGGMHTDLFPGPQTQVGLISPKRVINIINSLIPSAQLPCCVVLLFVSPSPYGCRAKYGQ